MDTAEPRMNEIVAFFFFQAEDGIRDGHVTGVQTCALPIYSLAVRTTRLSGSARRSASETVAWKRSPCKGEKRKEIGRASCRERVEITVSAVPGKKKMK